MRFKPGPLPKQVLNGLRASANKGLPKKVDEDDFGSFSLSPAPTLGWSLPSSPSTRPRQQELQDQRNQDIESPAMSPASHGSKPSRKESPARHIPSYKSGNLNFLASPALQLNASTRSVSSSSSGPKSPNKWWRNRGHENEARGTIYYFAADSPWDHVAAGSELDATGDELQTRHAVAVSEAMRRASKERQSENESTVARSPKGVVCNLAKSCWSKQKKVVRLRRRDSTLEAEFTVKERLSFQAYQEDMEKFASLEKSAWTGSKRGTNNQRCPRGSTHPGKLLVDLPVQRNEDEKPEPEWSAIEAQKLQRQYNVPMEVIVSARDIFDRYDLSGDGKLDVEEFELLLRSMLKEQYSNVKEIPRELFTRADASSDGQVDFAEFLQWFTMNAFLEKMLMPLGQQKVRALARKWEIPLDVVETIHKEFSRYDIDDSGSIEFEEFKKLLNTLLKIPAGLDLPNSRVVAFWKEIDIDGSGYVDFEEFLNWYRRYFDVQGGSTYMVSPIEKFYASVRGGGRPGWNDPGF